MASLSNVCSIDVFHTCFKRGINSSYYFITLSCGVQYLVSVMYFAKLNKAKKGTSINTHSFLLFFILNKLYF